MLLTVYKLIYHECEKAVEQYVQVNPEEAYLYKPVPTASPQANESSFSYNLAMTTTRMMIVPRRNEGHLLTKEDGSEIGFVALNGTLLGGTLMVRGEREWQWLKSKPEALDQALGAIGIPWNS
jgi:ATP adenylyltransferase